MAIRRQRIGRASLINHAAQLEHELNLVIDMTGQRAEESERMGLGISTTKLRNRVQQLEEARHEINNARQIIWDAL